MADLDRATRDAEGMLWDALSDLRAGMLGIVGATDQPQPMAHHAEPDADTLWFLTSQSTDLFKAVGAGTTGRFIVISKAQDFHAAMSGALTAQRDEAVLERMWNPVAASMYAGGRADPEVAMLSLRLSEAEIWASTGNPLAFAWEIAKASVRDAGPDLGVHAAITFG